MKFRGLILHMTCSTKIVQFIVCLFIVLDVVRARHHDIENNQFQIGSKHSSQLAPSDHSTLDNGKYFNNKNSK